MAVYYANKIIRLEKEHSFPKKEMIQWLEKIIHGRLTCPCHILLYTCNSCFKPWKKDCLFYPTSKIFSCSGCPRSKIWQKMRSFCKCEITKIRICRYLHKKLTKLLDLGDL